MDFPFLTPQLAFSLADSILYKVNPNLDSDPNPDPDLQRKWMQEL